MREELRAARAEARDFQRYRRVMAQTLGGVEAEVAALRRAALPEAAEARSEGARRRERSVEAFVGRQAARAPSATVCAPGRRERRPRRRPQRRRRAAPTMTRRRRSARATRCGR